MHSVPVLFASSLVLFLSSCYATMLPDIHFPTVPSDCDIDEECVRFSECENAVKAWKTRRVMTKTCYFKKNIQYVCCGVDVQSKSASFKSEKLTKENLSDKMCLAHHRFTDSVIVGGLDAVDWEFIYMAALRWGEYKGASSYNCGGVLISPNYVLTAAHCTLLNGEAPDHVRVGGENLTVAPLNDITIKRILTHPEYDPVTNSNDIALLELNETKYFAVGCLWHSPIPPSKAVTAIGYGQKSFSGKSSSILQKVNLTLYSNEDCEKAIQVKLNKNQICAGDWLGERDTCAGDSGGPILVKIESEERVLPYIVGITSFGGYCASGLPAVYTRISEYREWIESIVWNDVV